MCLNDRKKLCSSKPEFLCVDHPIVEFFQRMEVCKNKTAEKTGNSLTQNVTNLLLVSELAVER